MKSRQCAGGDVPLDGPVEFDGCPDQATTWGMVSHVPCSGSGYETETSPLPDDLRAIFPDTPETMYLVPFCDSCAQSFRVAWLAVFGVAPTRPIQTSR